MDWATLFERAEAYETDVETIREALDRQRSGGNQTESDRNSTGGHDDA